MSQTKTQNHTKQVNAAVLAIMQHAVDHQLPPILSIDSYSRDCSLTFRIEGDATAWLDSLVLVSEHNESADRPGWFRTSWAVKLPDTAVTFDLVTYRERPLQAVKA